MTLEEGIDKLAAEPLVSQPGAAFNYSLSTDVPRPRRRSRVRSAVQRVPARAHLQAAEDDRHRFHRAGSEVVAIRDGLFARRQGRHSSDDRSGIVRQHPHVAVDATTRKARPISPAAPGLASTASDYARFANMLLNGGALDGVRLLEPEDDRADDASVTRRS